MLGPLDDLLWHQIPSTFDHVGTSDPRFFDRWWFAIYDPAGSTASQVTMGVYNNMNVLDAGFVVVRDGTQHSVRASRALRPRFETDVAPFRIDLVEPLKRFRLRVEPGEHRMACDLDWQAALAPEEEHPHFARLRGRVTEEYQRFDQIGTVDGWIDIDGTRIDVDSWWTARDHSWGVRQGVGIAEPITGDTPPPSAVGRVFAFLFFATDELAGHVQIAEVGDDRTYLTGLLRRRGHGDAEVSVTDVDLDLTMHEGTRRIRVADLALQLDDGTSLTLRAEAMGSAIAMPGLGYSGGWDDRLGLGVYRGEHVVEHDVWDVSHPADVVREDGSVETPMHRLAAVRVSVLDDQGTDTGDRGTGSLTMIANGRLPRYGLG